jgi:large subunit ribosomal protein L22
MKVEAKLNNLNIAPRKARLVAHSIVGMTAGDATIELSKQVKRTSEPMGKLLASALANAEHNFGLDTDNLYVESVLVNEGTRLKRWQPHAFGRATPLLRRLSKIVLVLEEIAPGRNRKAKKASTKKEIVTTPADDVEEGVSEKEAEVREADGKKIEERSKAEETKRAVSMKQEMKERKNVVKKTYQRKSF